MSVGFLTLLPQISSSTSSGLNKYFSGDSFVTIRKPFLKALNCLSTLLFRMYSAYRSTNSCEFQMYRKTHSEAFVMVDFVNSVSQCHGFTCLLSLVTGVCSPSSFRSYNIGFPNRSVCDIWKVSDMSFSTLPVYSSSPFKLW